MAMLNSQMANHQNSANSAISSSAHLGLASLLGPSFSFIIRY